MPNICKGICSEVYKVRYVPYYKLGDRWCKGCHLAFMGFEPSITRCPCCGTSLRARCLKTYKKREYCERTILMLSGKLHENTKCSICGGGTRMQSVSIKKPYPLWRKLFGKDFCDFCFKKYYACVKEGDLLAALRRKEAKHKKELLVCQNLIAAYLKQREPMPVYCRA